MHQYHILLIPLILVITCFGLNQATRYSLINNSHKENIRPSMSAFVKRNGKNIHYQYHSKSPINTSKSPPFQNAPTKSNTKKQSHSLASNYTLLDFNDVDVVYNKCHEQKRLMLSKQLQSQKQELSEGYADFIYKTNQLVIAPKEATVISNDYYKTRYLAAYVTPLPLHSKMHQNLHHIKNTYVEFQKPPIVSYATGNEPSPMTTTSINSLTSLENMQQFLKTHTNENNIINNKLNKFNNDAETISQLNINLHKEGSKQFRYAPIRPSLEKELPYSSKTLPYPPSFISITTTEKPNQLDYDSIDHKIPDLFSNRYSKSLWDSYIPSWHITKMLHQLKNKSDYKSNYNNLQTLVYIKPYTN